MAVTPNTATGSPTFDMTTSVQHPVALSTSDLNPQGGIHCPHPKADMALWNSHPKVFLQVAQTGKACCPYCGTRYQLPAGPVALGGH